MAVDPLDQSSDRYLTVTMNEIKILVGMMTKLKELFPIEGHYYVHKACNILITICKQQLSTEDVDELTFTYTPQEVFISRACGYRVIFTNLEIRNNPGASRWIDDININLRTVENEDTTQVYISH